MLNISADVRIEQGDRIRGNTTPYWNTINNDNEQDLSALGCRSLSQVVQLFERRAGVKICNLRSRGVADLNTFKRGKIGCKNKKHRHTCFLCILWDQLPETRALAILVVKVFACLLRNNNSLKYTRWSVFVETLTSLEQMLLYMLLVYIICLLHDTR